MDRRMNLDRRAIGIVLLPYRHNRRAEESVVSANLVLAACLVEASKQQVYEMGVRLLTLSNFSQFLLLHSINVHLLVSNELYGGLPS
jgi:hypothetical protein